MTDSTQRKRLTSPKRRLPNLESNAPTLFNELTLSCRFISGPEEAELRMKIAAWIMENQISAQEHSLE
jgi:hypothetical protein